MVDDIEDKLRKAIDRGNRAERAYDLYIKEHIEETRKRLFNTFCSGQLSDSELMVLRDFATCITGLEAAVMADIDGAKIASKQLSDLNE